MLSRRDRAAMTLALECLRPMRDERKDRRHEERCLDEARRVLSAGDDVAEMLANACPTRHDWFDYSYPPRLLRARLALALRVLLRADLGDFGPTKHFGCSCACDGEWGGWLPVGYTPLWEQAPAHEVAR